MLRILPELLVLVLVVWTLVDCITTPEEELRGLPKVLWVLLILLFPLVGAVVYLLAGRPKRPVRIPGAGLTRRRVLAPDDDPAFLEQLRMQAWEQQRKRRDEGDTPPPNPRQ